MKLLSNTMGEMTVLIERASSQSRGVKKEMETFTRQLLTDDEFVHICLEDETDPTQMESAAVK